MSAFDYVNSNLTKYRSGSLTDPFIPINESKKIIAGKILLSEIPVQLNKVVISSFIEIMNIPDGGLTGNFFKVDYTEAIVYFSPEKEGVTVTVNYLGRGNTFISSKRVWLTESQGNVTETIDDRLIKQDSTLVQQNSRIDNIVASSGNSNTEIVDGRKPVSGVAYPTLKSRLDTEYNNLNAQLEDIEINVKAFGAKGDGATNNTAAIQAAIDYVVQMGGGTVSFNRGDFHSEYLVVPDNVYLVGKGLKTILRYRGTTGIFIDVQSHYQSRASISNMLIAPITNNKTASTIGINVKRTTNVWGVSAYFDNVKVEGFGVGIRFYMAFKSVVNDCMVDGCGTGIAYLAEIAGTGQNMASTFGNGNIVNNTYVLNSNIGMEFNIQQLFTMSGGGIEFCQIATLVYRSATSGSLANKKICFKNVWFESISKYVLCNSKIDSNLNATGAQSETSLNIFFSGCQLVLGPTPEIPNFNASYQTFSILKDWGDNARAIIPTDAPIVDIYNMAEDIQQMVGFGQNGPWRAVHSVSNKGVKARLSFNAHSENRSYTGTGTIERTFNINYSSLLKIDSSIPNNIASTAIVNIGVKHQDGSRSYACFLLHDYSIRTPIYASKLSQIDGYPGALSGYGFKIEQVPFTYPADKSIAISVFGKDIDYIQTTINHLPSGLLMTY